MSTFTEQEVREAAEKVAAKMTKLLNDAYVKSSTDNAHCFTKDLPDVEDFFAWLEGYEWEGARDGD